MDLYVTTSPWTSRFKRSAVLCPSMGQATVRRLRRAWPLRLSRWRTPLLGIVTALMDAQRTGQGRQVEVAMLEALYPAGDKPVSDAYQPRPSTRASRKPTPGARGGPYNVYRCKDGHIAVTRSRDTIGTSLSLMKRLNSLMMSALTRTQAGLGTTTN